MRWRSTYSSITILIMAVTGSANSAPIGPASVPPANRATMPVAGLMSMASFITRGTMT